MRRPFPNGRKRPFGCDGFVTAMAAGQSQWFCVDMPYSEVDAVLRNKNKKGSLLNSKMEFAPGSPSSPGCHQDYPVFSLPG